MKFGIEIPNAGLHGEPAIVAELAHEAESAGWDAFFVWDSLELVDVAPEVLPTCDPWIALTAAAMRTERIRLGTMITPLARRRPWKLARETVSLDRLSEGRMILPVGLGSPSDGGFANFGEALGRRERAERLDEGLEILSRLWTGESLSFEGRHFQVDSARQLPRPLQQPRIPIWVVAAWPRPRSVARALRWDGVIPFKMRGQENLSEQGMATAGGMQPEDIEALVEAIRDSRPAASRFDVVVNGFTSRRDPAKTRALAADYAAAGATWWIEGSAWRQMWSTPGDVEAVRARLRQGPPRPEA